MEYASSPDAQPTDHTRMCWRPSFCSTIAGSTCAASKSHALSSRKKLVTLIRIVLKRCVNSSGCTSRKSWYSSKLEIPTSCMRFRTRRVRLARLYPVKSKPRLSRT